jgi:hypothetical protein
MENITIKIDGLEELKKNVRFYKLLCPEATRKALKIIGFKVETLAKQIITSNESVVSGRTRASVSTNWAGSGMAEGKTGAQAQAGDGMGEPPGEKGMVVAVGTNVVYARRIEHGFFGPDSLGRVYAQQGKPYLFPAYFTYEGEVMGEIVKEFKKMAKD